jgi:hypothetical protein
VKVSEFCFKVLGTAIVLGVVTLGWAGLLNNQGSRAQSQDIMGIFWTIAFAGGVSLVIGIIANIWES